MADLSTDSVPNSSQPPTTSRMPTLTPATPVEVNLTLTIAFTSLYGLLFVMIFSQLFLILYYRHRRFSYQSVFLFICLIWAALRTTLFAFHFNTCDCAKVYELNSFWNWLLYEFPVFLQYLTLCLLAFYFGKAVLKTKWNLEPQKYRKQLRIIFGVFIFIFLTTTIVYSTVMSSIVNPSQETRKALGVSRVAISQMLFVLTAFALCVCILQLKRASSANLLLEGQGTTICQATTVCIIIGLLFVSRAVYNLLAVVISLPTFGYGWIYVSDEAETANGGTLRHETGSHGFVSFGLVLFIWELLPTFIVVWFFRVRRPSTEALVTSAITSNSFNRRSFFFDNIRRYDSDADLYTGHNSPPRHGSQYDVPGNGFSPNSVNSYSDISGKRNNSFGNRGNSFTAVPGTTPPLLFSGSNQYQPTSIGPVTEYR